MIPAATSPATLRVARVLTATEAEGPGLRMAIWVQGCTIRCPGCFNPQLWASAGGSDVSVADWSPAILADAVAAGVEGITLLGGEPFEQAAALAIVAAGARARGLSVMTFTGYDYADLRDWARHRPDIADLLTHTDLLADGPYRADLVDRERPWIGSTNQGLRALTDRYRDLEFTTVPDRVEVRVGADGTIAVNGWGDVDALDALLHDLGRRADQPRSTYLRLPNSTSASAASTPAPK
ncbi:4Fe-4S single cluster domain-containing protein [Nocardia lasii]|uniref:4Fe-4S single cluster domain-containing protein n=1 Tax=Nocardia lasii TaxID=1616107 RepID=A0ABW1JJJ2_9NOCA